MAGLGLKTGLIPRSYNGCILTLTWNPGGISGSSMCKIFMYMIV